MFSLNTKAAATVLGATKSHSVHNTVRNNQSVADVCVATACLVTRVCYQQFPTGKAVQIIKLLKAVGHVLFAGQYSKLTHLMVPYINMVHAPQCARDQISYQARPITHHQ